MAKEMRVMTQRPLNAETPNTALRTWITDNEVFFKRNQGQIPETPVSLTDWRLQVEGLVEKKLSLAFKDLQRLPKVEAAIRLHGKEKDRLVELQRLQEKADSCTPRERDVMKLLARGLPNKGIADSLGISPRTVEIHRAHVMEKMEADSLPALVRMVALLESRLR